MIGKFFVAFLSATLAKNPLNPNQPQFKQSFELTRFQVIAPDYNVFNSPPIISNFVEHLTVFANESKQVKVADLVDLEDKNTLTVKLEAACPNNPSDWIKLLDASTSEINLVYKAPSDLKDDLCTVDLTVNDNNPIKPMSVKKTV